jgi:surfactin synthase thioesterase subunit
VPKRISDRDDEKLLAWLEGFGGFPPGLREYPSYLRYALRTVRRDLALTEVYRSSGPVPVSCPLHVFGGAEDPLVGGAELGRWRACASAGFTLQLLPGGHDYLFTGAPAVLDAVTAVLG